MDSFEVNKILGAILGTLLFVMGLGFLAEAIYAPIEGKGPGYTLAGAVEHDGETVETAEPVAETSISVLLASASAEAGEGVARRCAACHTFEPGGANKQGPNLYDIVGRPIASNESFAYSDALIEAQQRDGTWSFEHLDAFLLGPKAYAPGTKMTFGGLTRDQERADLLAYLQSLSDSPVPLPEAEAEAPAEDADTEAGANAEGAPAY